MISGFGLGLFFRRERGGGRHTWHNVVAGVAQAVSHVFVHAGLFSERPYKVSPLGIVTFQAETIDRT